MYRRLFFPILLVLYSCASDVQAASADELLSDQVYGCGKVFGEDIATELEMAYQKNLRSGDKGAVASRKTVVAMLNILPENDNLENYKLYVTCLSNKLSSSLTVFSPGTSAAAASPDRSLPSYQEVTSICTGIDDSRLAMMLVDTKQFSALSFAEFGIENEQAFNAYRYCVFTFVIN